jgi:Ricin-type beta-trefoil lectin domain-like/Glycosyl hydrolases family 43
MSGFAALVLLTALALAAPASAGAQTTYHEIENLNSKSCMDVVGGSTADGAGVQQWGCWGAPQQQWALIPSNHANYYEIVNQNSGKCLDVPNGSLTDGTHLQQWDCWDGPQQQWRVINWDGQDNGYYHLANYNSGLVVDVPYSSTQNGTPLQQWEPWTTAGQKWQGNLPAPQNGVTVNNPVQYQGRPMGCPDPDVFNYQGGYVASCTSGPDQPGMPIYYSPDLIHWMLKAYINPPASMIQPYGQEWADEIHYINGFWTAWYAISRPGTGQMEIVESWSQNLFQSNWSTKVIYNTEMAFDPSIQWDPQQPGVLDMVFCQGGSIYITSLAGPNWHIVSTPRLISSPTLSWEGNWEEGPVIWNVNGQQYLFVNTNNSFNGTYSIAIEHTDGPALTGTYTKQSTPLITGDPAYPNLMGPGIGGQPFKGPSGEWVLAHHVVAPPNTYAMTSRPLCFEYLDLGPNGPWVDGGHPWPTVTL